MAEQVVGASPLGVAVAGPRHHAQPSGAADRRRDSRERDYGTRKCSASFRLSARPRGYTQLQRNLQLCSGRPLGESPKNRRTVHTELAAHACIVAVSSELVCVCVSLERVVTICLAAIFLSRYISTCVQAGACGKGRACRDRFLLAIPNTKQLHIIWGPCTLKLRGKA